jgi:alkanesulfonate monooxygenase SsuD/methylene tetrahydromethanopterin reductase-like flavin-dependent oxidoreductase (luciferase family)
VQASIPILVGGDTEAAIQRAVRIADGYFPGEGDAARLGALIARLRRAAERAGRDPSSLQINAMFGAQMADPLAGAEQLAALGVARAMVPAFFFAGPGGLDRLSEFGERVIRSVKR